MSIVRNMSVKSVDEPCPICGNKDGGGWMRSTGIIITSNPPMYHHKCTVCNCEQTYLVKYPYIIHE